MRDLTAKIPSGTPEHHELIAASDETIAAVLATINEVVRKHQEFARFVLEKIETVNFYKLFVRIFKP